MAAGNKKPDFDLSEFGDLQPKGVLSKEDAPAAAPPAAPAKAAPKTEKRPKDAKPADLRAGARKMGGEGGRPTFKENTVCSRMNMYLPVETIARIKRTYLVDHPGEFRSMTELVDRAINTFIDGGCK